MTGYALFYYGKQISKPHSTEAAAKIEAFEHSAVGRWRRGKFLHAGFAIASVPSTPSHTDSQPQSENQEGG